MMKFIIFVRAGASKNKEIDLEHMKPETNLQSLMSYFLVKIFAISFAILDRSNASADYKPYGCQYHKPYGYQYLVTAHELQKLILLVVAGKKLSIIHFSTPPLQYDMRKEIDSEECEVVKKERMTATASMAKVVTRYLYADPTETVDFVLLSF